MPHDRVRLVAERGLSCVGLAVQDVTEDVARVVQDDVEDHVHATRMDLVDQGAQFVLGQPGIGPGGGRGGGEPGLDPQEILDAIAVKGPGLELAILQDRCEPDGPSARCSM